MTFDEVLNKLEPRTIWSGEMRDLLELLREEYAPTIEMTQAQKDVFLFYKKMTWFSLFISKLNEENNMVFATLPDVSCFGNWGVSKEIEIELMQAWIHPEIIKIVKGAKR